MKRGLCILSFKDNNGTIINTFKNGLESYLTSDGNLKIFHKYKYRTYEKVVIIIVNVLIQNNAEEKFISIYKCNLPNSVDFVRNSVKVNGLAIKNVNIRNGIVLPNLKRSECCLIEYIIMKKIKN